MSSDTESRSLIRKTLAGERKATQELERRLSPVICARIRRRLSPFEAGEEDRVADLAQSVWVVLFENQADLLRRYDPSRGASLENFVGMITDREIINLHRKQRALKRGGDLTRVSASELLDRPSTEASPEQQCLVRELDHRVERLIHAHLSSMELLIWRMKTVDTRRSSEIAHLLHLKPQAVYATVRRIRRLIERMVEPKMGLTLSPCAENWLSSSV